MKPSHDYHTLIILTGLSKRHCSSEGGGEALTADEQGIIDNYYLQDSTCYNVCIGVLPTLPETPHSPHHDPSDILGTNLSLNCIKCLFVTPTAPSPKEARIA